MNVAKILRTAQSHFPALKPAKDVFYRHARRLARQPHERDFSVLRHLVRASGEVLVDVGANHGQTIESMRLFEKAAPIVAFEANPRLAAALAHRYRPRADVRIEGCGLGDAAGTFTLHVPSYRGFVYDGLASVDRAEAAGWLGPATLYRFDPGAVTIAEIACRIARLDDFDLTPAFLKIDVQGLEHAVLVGGYQTIARHRPAILLEAFETDDRTERLATDLGYRVAHVADGNVADGLGPGPNTLLLPLDRQRFA